MMKHIAIALLVCSFAATSFARELDDVVKALPGMQADFTQRFTPKGFTKAQTDRGTVIFGNLPKMRWSYAGSEPRLFVFDGQQSSLYTPAEKQVQVVTLDAARQKSVPFSFLWSGGAMRDYSYSEKRNGANVDITMKPLSNAAEFRQVALQVDAASHTIKRVEYADRSGNRTVFDFTAYRKANVNAETFRFTPPPGVEVVRN